MRSRIFKTNTSHAPCGYGKKTQTARRSCLAPQVISSNPRLTRGPSQFPFHTILILTRW